MTYVIHSAVEAIAATIAARGLAGAGTPVVLMVSGGGDSTALAYAASELHAAGRLGPCAVFHLNHGLRGADALGDAAFVQRLCDALGMPCYAADADLPAIVRQTGGNTEAVARKVRYGVARDVAKMFCASLGLPEDAARIFTAHTQDDRVENFYMRSIVGTGPGGFRGMDYAAGQVAHPCLDVSRAQLRAYLEQRAARADAGADVAVVRDEAGALWRTDATNASTDRFRAYVRERIVPAAAARNPALLDVLCRTMNLIADEDDYLDAQADALVRDLASGGGPGGSCLLDPAFGGRPVVLQRRAVLKLLQGMLPPDARVEAASVEAVLRAFEGGVPKGGYVANIQGDLAVSANKRGVLIEPMGVFRARRKRV